MLNVKNVSLDKINKLIMKIIFQNVKFFKIVNKTNLLKDYL